MGNFTFDGIKDANADWQPIRLLIHSAEGQGKSTFASTFDLPIAARTEDGAGEIAIKTFPDLVTSYQDMVDTIQALHGDHPFKSLVVDTADWFEPHVWAKTMEMNPTDRKGNAVHNIEDYGYGDGYKFALNWWRNILSGFDSLRANKGMNIIILIHSRIEKIALPTAEPFNSFGFKLNDLAGALLAEWSDMIAFIDTEKDVVKDSKNSARATSDGNRVLYVESRPAFRAKNHYGLPSRITIGRDRTWADFHKAMAKATNGRYPMPQSFYGNTEQENK